MTDLRMIQPPEPGTQPDFCHPPYVSSLKRSPRNPLVLMPEALSRCSGPVFGPGIAGALDHDLTAQHAGEPIGERILVHGRLLDEDGRPVRNALVEVWQANAAGRYRHKADQCNMPLDPNFTGAGRTLTDADGHFLFRTIKPGPYPVEKSLQRLATGPHSFLLVRSGHSFAPGHADVFSRRPAPALRSYLQQHRG